MIPWNNTERNREAHEMCLMVCDGRVQCAVGNQLRGCQWHVREGILFSRAQR